MIPLRMLILFAVAHLLVNLYIALFDIRVIVTVSVFSTAPLNFVVVSNFRMPPILYCAVAGAEHKIEALKISCAGLCAPNFKSALALM